MKILLIISLLIVVKIESRDLPLEYNEIPENPFIKAMVMNVMLDKLMETDLSDVRNHHEWQNGRYSRFTRLQ